MTVISTSSELAYVINEMSVEFTEFRKCSLCEEVRRRTGLSPVTSTIVARRLRLFGHIARADPSQDHSRALQTAINRLPTDWRRRRGRPRRTWLRTIESDLQPTNLGLNSAWLRAQDRSKWRSVMETAMLTAGRAT